MAACFRDPTLDFLSSLTTLIPRPMAFATSMLRAPKFILSCLDLSPHIHIQWPTQHLNCMSNMHLKDSTVKQDPYYHPPAWNLASRLHPALRIESCQAPSPHSPWGPFLDPRPVCFGAFAFSYALARKALSPGLGMVRSFSSFRS